MILIVGNKVSERTKRREKSSRDNARGGSFVYARVLHFHVEKMIRCNPRGSDMAITLP